MSSTSKSRRRLRVCKCKSHCTVYNPSTRQFEGDGRLQTRWTRDNHLRDDARLATRIRLASGALVNSSSTTTTSIDVQYSPATSWMRLFQREIRFYNELPIISPQLPLVFINDPREHGGYDHGMITEIIHPNQGKHALNSKSAANAAFLQVENRLCEMVRLIPTIDTSDDAQALVDRLYRQLHRLSLEKQLQWLQQRINRDHPDSIVINTDIHFTVHGPRVPAAKAAAIISLILQNMFFTPRRALRAQLASIRDILRIADVPSEILRSIPQDPRTSYSQFYFDPVTHTYICCPRCFCLYPFQPEPGPGAPTHHIIAFCTHKNTSQSRLCGTSLWKQQRLSSNRAIQVPILKYVHNDLKSWLGRLLARPGIEDLLEQTGHLQNPQDSAIYDIWGSKVFQTLKDNSGQHFLRGTSNEGRLVFALAADGFNPFYLKQAKQSVTTFGIWLVLLNLPPHLRYLPENIFPVGFIPGKPSSEQINHAIQLLVNDLQEFWSPGVRFSRTWKYRLGRLIQAMLVPLIADMLGARQLAGFPGAPTAHNFCTFCELDIDDIAVLDRSEWPQKDEEQHRRHACQWRDAHDDRTQSKLFNAYGVRWSPLLDLSYWKPTLWTIIESMHVLDLNLFQNHCRELFQINAKKKGSDGSILGAPFQYNLRATSKQEKALMRRALLLTDTGSETLEEELLGLDAPRRVFYTICEDLNIRGDGHQLVVGTKWILVRNICSWRFAEDFSGRNQLGLQSLINGAQSAGNTPSIAESELTPSIAESEMESEPEDDSPAAAVTSSYHSSQKHHLPPDDDMSEKDLQTAARIIRHLTGMKPAKQDSLLKQATIKILQYLCNLVSLEQPATRQGKLQIYNALETWVSESEEHTDLLQTFIIDKSSLQRHILGADVMAAVWHDMKCTELPSWVGAAPPDWGTAARGKLSADHWRVICTVHLPITLIRLWCNDTGRRRELLENFMDLVAAVRIANQRVTSPEQIEAYNGYITRYVKGIKRLFPDEKLRPTHHMALHIGDIAALFGPVHSHSAPFYERYIHILQRISTNRIIGKMEGTFMQVCSHSANIRAVLSDDREIRSLVSETIRTLDNIKKEDARGIYLVNMLDLNQPGNALFADLQGAQTHYLSDDEHMLLYSLVRRDLPHESQSSLPHQVHSFKHISQHGVRYAAHTSRQPGDSSILFHSHPVSLVRDRQQAGTIRTIFQFPPQLHTPWRNILGGKTYMHVAEYLPTSSSEAPRDPYADFSFAGGFICRGIPEREHVIQVSQVISHFVKTPMAIGSQQFIHVLPVDCMMQSFKTIDAEIGAG